MMAEAALLRHHSDYAEAIQVLRRAISESEGDSRTKCEALLSIVDLHLRLGEYDQAKQNFDAARQTGSTSRRHQAYFILTRGRIDEGRGETEEASNQYQEAFDLARRAHASDLALESIAAWSRLAYLTGGPDIALRVINTAVPEARQAGRMDIVFNLLLIRARAYLDTGRSDLAELEMNAIKSEAESMGYLTQLTYTLSGLAAVAVEHSRWAEGGAYAKQTMALAERLGNDMVLGYTLALLCTSEFRQVDQGGDQRLLDEAVAHGVRSVEVLGRLPPSDSLVLAHGYLSEVYLYKKMKDDAVEHYNRAIELAGKLRLGWLRDRLTAELGTRIAGSKGVVVPADSPRAT